MAGHLKYKAEGQLHEHVVADALSKIIEINAKEQSRFGTALAAQTPAGLMRARDELFAGLTIVPDRGKDLKLPPEPDLFGHIIPAAEAQDCQGTQTSENLLENNRPQSGRSGDWSFDDDK